MVSADRIHVAHLRYTNVLQIISTTCTINFGVKASQKKEIDSTNSLPLPQPSMQFPSSRIQTIAIFIKLCWNIFRKAIQGFKLWFKYSIASFFFFSFCPLFLHMKATEWMIVYFYFFFWTSVTLQKLRECGKVMEWQKKKHKKMKGSQMADITNLIASWQPLSVMASVWVSGGCWISIVLALRPFLPHSGT